MVSRHLSEQRPDSFMCFILFIFCLFKVASILAKVIPVAHSSPEPALMPFNTESYPGARVALWLDTLVRIRK